MTHYAERLNHHDPLNTFENHAYPESFRDLDLLAEDETYDHHPRQTRFHGGDYHRDPLLSHHGDFGNNLGYHHSDGLMNDLDYHERFDHPSSHLGGIGSHPPLTRDHLHHHDLDLHGYNPPLVDTYYNRMHDVLPRHLPYYDQDAFMGYGGLGGSSGMGMEGMGYGTGLGYGTDMGYGVGLGHGASLGYGAGMGMGMGSTIGMDPFVDGINHDYGYGRVPPLSSYGLSPTGFQPSHGPMLDDLYLFELMLRSDQLLSERERLNRWEERMRWEELNDLERENQWKQMSLMRRAQLGLGGGSYWGSQLGGVPIDHSLGYHNMIPASGRSAISAGILGQPHYGLSSGLATRYPMWGIGGLGMGRRISNHRLRPRHLIRQANIRRDYAERRGEIPPRPRIVGPGLMGTGVPAQHCGLRAGLGLLMCFGPVFIYIFIIKCIISATSMSSRDLYLNADPKHERHIYNVSHHKQAARTAMRGGAV
ncbi:uncharacterized protein MELLADRAFT_106705 [Melampsora larici-populina 98AG31]|uniref:Uncharacterized protein n=1 Tax=Melampsora larici-populina (strain 98AG31 / pathotype 3-4-7) TaxID=747676 RepID=F4RMD2_MELLP|nr:uncharacterized protein MELLADRAFT_106705 [Melampsora larici-populina 98AG31]EGG06408.1 hypothetical protein MELLADRAFT_106705 [Melampsora larici-populina 98AG31]